MNLESTLKEHWPPNRIVASCGQCGKEFYDTHKEDPTMAGYSFFSILLKIYARKHKKHTGHKDLQVDINKEPTPVREIDCEITVND